MTAKAWGIPIHVWGTYPRQARAKMTAIRQAESKLLRIAYDSRKPENSNNG